MREKAIILVVSLLILCQGAFTLHVLEKLAFLHAWGIVKKIRVDRLEKGICDDPTK